jgi:hypothetical protein
MAESGGSGEDEASSESASGPLTEIKALCSKLASRIEAKPAGLPGLTFASTAPGERPARLTEPPNPALEVANGFAVTLIFPKNGEPHDQTRISLNPALSARRHSL